MDTAALTQQLDLHRMTVYGHCYRMLGSAAEAEDAVQEAMVRAWKALDRFEARSKVTTWLHRIATNVCLDMLAERKRRLTPFDEGEPNNISLLQRPRAHWLEPVPDARVVPQDIGPDARLTLRQNIRLAFVAALQHLPPKQRAALLLCDVIGCSAAEAAETLDLSVPAVNSALQRARAAMAQRETDEYAVELSAEQTALLGRYVELFERYDVDALMSLLREDAAHCMPPYALWLQGTGVIRNWMLEQGAGCRGSKLIPTRANGHPAFGQYRPGAPGEPHQPWSLIVLELAGDRIARVHNFLDTTTLFPVFGLPPQFNATTP